MTELAQWHGPFSYGILSGERYQGLTDEGAASNTRKPVRCIHFPPQGSDTWHSATELPLEQEPHRKSLRKPGQTVPSMFTDSAQINVLPHDLPTSTAAPLQTLLHTITGMIL